MTRVTSSRTVTARLYSFAGTTSPELDVSDSRNEQVAAWDEVTIDDDDRTLTLARIHSTPWASSPDTWWATADAEVEATDEAVSVRVLLVEQSGPGPSARRFDDPARTVRVVLDEPLRRRPVVDGCARLVGPRPDTAQPPALEPFHRVRQADERTLIVYWYGGPYVPLDHISTEWRDHTLLIGVWLCGGIVAASGAYEAALVRLDRPLGDRKIRDLARGYRKMWGGLRKWRRPLG